jgi:branched-chain amino acid transport system ATP-binding protein
MSRLQVDGLVKHFGGVTAVNGVSLTVEPGERHAIIGPNGAGKSTLFNLIAGELAPTAGAVSLDGRDITHLPVHQRTRLGVGRTFQRNNLLPGLTVLENVWLAVQQRQGIGRHWFRAATHFTAVRERAEAILAQVGLLPEGEALVKELAYGQQRALEIALALATDPTILLLDEPTAGMSPAETAEMTRLISTLPRALTLLIVEHDMDVVFSLADRLTVLHYGQVVSQGTPAAVRADPLAQKIYLGGLTADER